MDVRFASSDDRKIREATEILGSLGITVLPARIIIEELQTEDEDLKAFGRIGRPVFVEHTFLHLHGLNGLPGGLTRIFWDRLQADAFLTLARSTGGRMTARSVVGYCDSRRVHYFKGEVRGTVPDVPAGPEAFAWDRVFVPEGSDQTFAELGDRKKEISMRRGALELFAAHLKRLP
jgi:XTP/dITP diphosphohydrolase